MHILTVDDDAMAAAIVSMILEDAGYEVMVAKDGEQALGLIADKSDFAVIISDLNMPGMDGIELHRTIRAGGCRTPFILLSGDDPEKLRHRAPDIEVCLMKDDTLEETLVDAVARVLVPSAL